MKYEICSCCGKSKKPKGYRESSSGRHPSNFYITHVTLPVYRLDDTHPLGVTAYIRGYFDGYDRVADLRKMRGADDAQADAGTLEVIAQDIPQPWLEYFMQTKEDLGCVRVGTKRVRNNSGSTRESKRGDNLVYGKYNRRPQSEKYGDADGLEVVSDFDCARDESGRFVCPVALLDEQAGERGGHSVASGPTLGDGFFGLYTGKGMGKIPFYNDKGGPSRFLHNSDWSHEQHYADATSQRIEDANAVRYQAKPSRREKEAGLGPEFESKNNRVIGRNHLQCNVCSSERIDSGGLMCGHNDSSWVPNADDKGENNHGGTTRNSHPTIKSISLMKYLAGLLLPPDAYAPRRLAVYFGGSGSAAIGAGLAGWEHVTEVEMEADYVAIARARNTWWENESSYGQTDPAVILANAPSEANSSGDVQLDLFDNSSVSDKAHDMLYERAKFEEAAAVLKMCVICGFEEDGGNTSLDCGVHYMCDEHLLQGDALDHECDEYNDKSDAP